MASYMVLYKAPVRVLDEWMKADEATRKAEEAKMQAEWGTWMAAHAGALKGTTAGLGKTKVVTSAGTTDTKNDLMLYSMVEAESPEAAAQMFAGHPHLSIPEASIEIMPVNPLPGMSGMQ